MASSGKLGRMALVRTDDSEELSASFIEVTRMGKLGTLVVTSKLVLHRSVRRLLVTAIVVRSLPISCHPDERGAKFLRNVGSYKSHTT
jgi:hypothetical protein